MTREISIDLESMSLEPNAMILSIGAVEFDRDGGGLGNYFYRTIDIDAKGGGGVMDASTVKWWMNQSQEARDRVFADPDAVPLAQALIDFSEWLGFDDTLPEGEYPDIHLWQRGDKDGQWLACAYEGLGLKLPYRYNQISDQRTITDLFPKEWFVWDGTAHDALSDATVQARHLMQALAVLQPAIAHAYKQVEEAEEPVDGGEGLKVRQDTLMMGYACGLTTVGEALENIRLHSGNMWPYTEIKERWQEVVDAFLGYTGEELILDTLLPENKAKIDGELEEMARMSPADEECPPCGDMVESAKEALSPENQRITPCNNPMTTGAVYPGDYVPENPPGSRF